MAIGLTTASSGQSPARADEIARGKYLATLAGCTDCHTPGHFLGKPDLTRYLGGSDVGFDVPGLGKFFGPNLTPDQETGLGKWTKDEIVKAMRTGLRPDGRQLAPVMPFMAYASLTDEDANAIAAFLQSLPAVSHKAPGPFGPDDKASSLLLRVTEP